MVSYYQFPRPFFWVREKLGMAQVSNIQHIISNILELSKEDEVIEQLNILNYHSVYANLKKILYQLIYELMDFR